VRSSWCSIPESTSVQALLAYIVRLSMYSLIVHSSVKSDTASCVTAVHAAAKGETTAFMSEPYEAVRHPATQPKKSLGWAKE
jgi:hypothetical protein